ncbi:MAG: helix-turn-helix domain-containing protein [Clostridia bacterium]|nr:helix-turn-helix domain-containing protein [Clostridia bacterium]
MSIFDEIKIGLNQAISYEKGVLPAKTKKLSITPLNTFTAKEIKNIRMQLGLTQSVFAQCLGVSVKTVEAWEAGRNHPDGAACRLLALTQCDPSFFYTSGIVASCNG